MIFPDVSVEEWCKQWRLKPVGTKCTECGNKIVSDRPYRAKDYVGLTSRPCPCGQSNQSCGTHLAVSKAEIAAWDNLLGDFI